MATYTELHAELNDAGSLQRVAVALLISGRALIASGTLTVNDRRWLKTAMYNPSGEAVKAWNNILAENAGSDITQIKNVTDAQLQAQVDLIVPVLIATFTPV
jgi:hypothetical protein